MIHISLKSYQVVFLASLSYAKIINNEKIFFLYLTKILQKSGIQKNEVIELIYRGFI